MIDTGWRYGVYASLAILGGTFYVLLDDGDEGAVETVADRAHGQAELQALNALSSNGRTAVKRDLFALAAPPAPVSVAPEISAPPPPPSAAPVDRLAEIQVVGLVSQKGRQAILIKAGEDIVTILAGQRFGRDEALEVGLIEAGQIRVLDHAAHLSKTFMLSEE